MNPDGLILVDKPANMTSFAVDMAMRKILGTKKVGHLGTLDPFATGLLPVFAGKGLKYLRFCDGFDKSYSCRAFFGAATDSMDSEGEITFENYPSKEQMEDLRSTAVSSALCCLLCISAIKRSAETASWVMVCCWW